MADFRDILGTLQPWIHSYGTAAIFVVLILESFGMPLPGESLLIVGSVLAGRGDISMPALLLSAWAGSVIGDNIGYLAGRILGHRALLRFGGLIGVKESNLQKAEITFAKYGSLTVGFARFIVILRQLNGVVAGTLTMDWPRFIVFNAIGAVLWVSVWTTAGYCLGRHGSDVKTIIHKLGFVGMIALSAMLIIAVGYLYLKRFFHRR